MKIIADIVIIYQANFISAVYIEDQPLINMILTKLFPFKYSTFPKAMCNSVEMIFVSMNNKIEKDKQRWIKSNCITYKCNATFIEFIS